MLTPETRALLRDASTPRRADRPEVGVEPGFKPRQRHEVGPRVAVQDRGDGRVVHAADAADLAGRASIHRLPQPDGHEPSDLTGGVAGLTLGPVGDQGRGCGSSDAGHAVRVRLSVVADPEPGDFGERPAEQPTVGGARNDGSNHHRTPLAEGAQHRHPPKVEHVIRTYTPKIPAEHWAVIGDFVRAAVDDCDGLTPYEASNLMHAASHHVHWTWRVAGLPLERDAVFRPAVVQEFIARGCSSFWSPSIRGNRRSQLMRMSELLLGPDLAPVRGEPLPNPDPSSPYSAAEVTSLRSWANGQSTPFRIVNANVLLALGLGAGLSTSEIVGARAEHVTVDVDGVLVEVTGKRARVVTVIAEWESVLADVADAAMHGDMPLFRPRCSREAQHLVSNFVSDGQKGRVRAIPQRMRATWLVTHMAAGTPVVALMAAAGVDSLEALTRYVRFVPDLDPTFVRRRLRHGTGGVR